ncbi:MAG: hypothetical protein ABI390_12060 [Daejeonella sp.]
MKNPSIEINDSEYLIKLPRANFKLSFINHLFKRIEAEQKFFSMNLHDEEDIISRISNQNRYPRFDHLDDK